MTLSATERLRARRWRVGKASGGRASTRIPATAKPLQPGSGHDHVHFLQPAPCAPTCAAFPPCPKRLASTEHAVSAVGFEPCEASLTRFVPCLYWRTRAPGSHASAPSSASRRCREPRVGLGAELQDRINSPRDVAGHPPVPGTAAALPANAIKDLQSLFMFVSDRLCGFYYYVRPARASRVPCNDAARS